MYKITMTVRHGKTYVETAEGATLDDAIQELRKTALGVGYMPANPDNQLELSDTLHAIGSVQIGWADYTATMV